MEQSNNSNNIVKAESKASKYNYASLSDIAKQGYKIPLMSIGIDEHNGKEYVYYYDGVINGWVQGAQIVVPSPVLNKDGRATMNEAQLYGSALTYARRYTTMMALGLACDDDKNLEDNEPVYATDKQVAYIKKLYHPSKYEQICKHYGVDCLEHLTIDMAKTIISKANEAKQ